MATVARVLAEHHGSEEDGALHLRRALDVASHAALVSRIVASSQRELDDLDAAARLQQLESAPSQR